MCLYKIRIKNKKYMVNGKNEGNVPDMKDERLNYIEVPCGRCMECKRSKGNEWRVRLSEEIRQRKDGVFVTLTYSDESLIELGKDAKGFGYSFENDIARLSIKRMSERYRAREGKALRHWLVTELGGQYSERIHLHGLIFCKNDYNQIKKDWKYGNIWIGDYVSEKTINYMTKYVMKIDLKHREYKSKIFTSQGMGKGFLKREDSKLNVFKGEKTDLSYTNRKGFKMNLPRYYKLKLWNEEQREDMMINLLDRNIKVVGKREYNMNTEEEAYENALRQGKIRNLDLGFPTNKKDWHSVISENLKRNERFRERIRKFEKKEYICEDNTLDERYDSDDERVQRILEKNYKFRLEDYRHHFDE